ncbi:phasin family protein [Bradyrhizobium sp. MOS003]|uniref:phasin family protein n=1 Tax=Bradyrhizobium sp. MOS003 TaxID=2133946 RepID=UPI0013146E1A|nr:phasin family protein [Bradyrhizobium sp. MOS003]
MSIEMPACRWGMSPVPMAMRRNVNALFDFGDKHIQAGDMQDALKNQSNFFQAQMQLLADQTTH